MCFDIRTLDRRTYPGSLVCIILLEATSTENMSALLEFIYAGVVQVSQETQEN